MRKGSVGARGEERFEQNETLACSPCPIASCRAVALMPPGDVATAAQDRPCACDRRLPPMAAQPPRGGRGRTVGAQPHSGHRRDASLDHAATAAAERSGRDQARIQFAPIVGTSRRSRAALSERLAAAPANAASRLPAAATRHDAYAEGLFHAGFRGRRPPSSMSGTSTTRPETGFIASGQQKARAREGWSAVSPATMQAIADPTIDQFAHLAGAPRRLNGACRANQFFGLCERKSAAALAIAAQGR